MHKQEDILTRHPDLHIEEEQQELPDFPTFKEAAELYSDPDDEEAQRELANFCMDIYGDILDV